MDARVALGRRSVLSWAFMLDGFPAGPYRVHSGYITNTWARLLVAGTLAPLLSIGAVALLADACSRSTDTTDEQERGVHTGAQPQSGLRVLMALAGLGLMAFGLGRVARMAWHDRRHAAAAATQGAARPCKLVGRKLDQDVLGTKWSGWEEVTFEVPSDGKSILVTKKLKTERANLLFVVVDKVVLALVVPNAPREAVLLLEDYYPFELTAAGRKAADDAIQAERARQTGSSEAPERRAK